jgi:hypothetical protein
MTKISNTIIIKSMLPLQGAQLMIIILDPRRCHWAKIYCSFRAKAVFSG